MAASRTLPRGLALASVVLALALLLPCPGHAQSAPTPPSVGGLQRVEVATLAERLGLTIASRRIDELDLGNSVTGTLAKPEKLAAFGIAGMHPGARVTVMRSAPDRLRIEADELDPVERRAAVTVRLDANGAPVPKKE